MLRRALVAILLAPTVAMAGWTEHGVVNEILFGVDYTDYDNGWTAGGKDGIGPRINKFEDGGATWYNQTSDMLTMMWLNIDMATSKVGYAGGMAAFLPKGSVAKTTNGGKTWETIFDGSSIAVFPDIQALDENTVIAAGMWTYLLQERQGLLISKNGGNSWTRHQWGVPEWVAGSWFVDEQHGFVVGGTWPTDSAQATFRNVYHPQRVIGRPGTQDTPYKAVVLRTDDGANSFTKVFEQDGFTVNRVHFINRHEGWLACFWDDAVNYKGKLFHTTDAGNTWEEQSIPCADYATMNDVHFFNRREGWAVGFRTGMVTVQSVAIHTTDGGQTWVEDPYSKNIGPANMSWVNEGEGWYTGGNDLQYSRMVQFYDASRIPRVQVDHLAPPATVPAGGSLEWQVRLTNLGNQAQSGAVWLSITGPQLPAGLSPYKVLLMEDVTLPPLSSEVGTVALPVPAGTPRGEYDVELLMGSDRSEDPRQILGYGQFMVTVN